MADEAQTTQVHSPPAENVASKASDTPAGSERPAKPGKPAKGAKGAGKPAKSQKGKDGAGAGARGAGGQRNGGGGSRLVLAEHPRAVRGIARAKAWGGLGGFLVGGYLSLPTHTLPDTGLHALAAGVVCYVAAWGAAVFLWRHLVVAELRDAQQELLAVEIAKLGPPHPPAGASESRSTA
jgi:hypothetical protein